MEIQHVLAFNCVDFKYANNGSYVVKGLNFSVNDGEFVSIIGPSGSGKTTLFRLITGLENPSSGTIQINGHYTEKRLGSVGYMPQQDLLMPWRTVYENVVVPLEIKGINPRSQKEEIYDMLNEFGLKGFEQEYPNKLSGGMKQRVSFLRTILTGAKVLLLDEPFSALDAITRLAMQEWLVDKWENLKKTILFITHDVDEALLLSDRIFIITDKPITHFKEIIVPLGRPRKIRDLAQPEIITIKELMLKELRMDVDTYENN
nr:ABC transporter ATP-binding protein [Calidifontibacillus erzurumensis]